MTNAPVLNYRRPDAPDLLRPRFSMRFAVTAAAPSTGSCMNMNAIIVSSVPPWNAGVTKASPIKPPSDSHSDVIIGIICADEVLLNWDRGKRSIR